MTFKIVAEAKFLGMIKKEFGKSKVMNQVSWLEKDLQGIPFSQWVKPLGLKNTPINEDVV